MNEISRFNSGIKAHFPVSLTLYQIYNIFNHAKESAMNLEHFFTILIIKIYLTIYDTNYLLSS